MLTRRQFLLKCRDISILMCGSTLLSRSLAEGFIKLSKEPPVLAFIHGQNCLGCTTSMMYGNDHDFIDFVHYIARIGAHPSLSFASGQDYMDNLDRVAATGDYLLIVEGSIPKTPPEACYLGTTPLYHSLENYLRGARMVICSGSCSSHGGIPASGGNRTGALAVDAYMAEKKIVTPLLRVPGCPAHPDHLMGSIAYLAATGNAPPFLPNTARIKEYYGELLHNRCGRFRAFSQDQFVENYATNKHDCLLKKGCRGPVTASDCPVRRWNNRTSVCVDSNTPCIGCMNPDWPFTSDLYLDTSDVEDRPWSQLKQNKNRRQQE